MKVMDVAAWFCEREAMNYEKLEGMVYLAYAWFYTLHQQELFTTSGFRALSIMPSEPCLHQKFHHLGKRKIHYIPATELPQNIKMFLESVYDTYHEAEGSTLIAYLRTSTPYLKARQRENHQILRKDMKAYYERQMAD